MTTTKDSAPAAPKPGPKRAAPEPPEIPATPASPASPAPSRTPKDQPRTMRDQRLARLGKKKTDKPGNKSADEPAS